MFLRIGSDLAHCWQRSLHSWCLDGPQEVHAVQDRGCRRWEMDPLRWNWSSTCMNTRVVGLQMIVLSSISTCPRDGRWIAPYHAIESPTCYSGGNGGAAIVRRRWNRFFFCAVFGASVDRRTWDSGAVELAAFSWETSGLFRLRRLECQQSARKIRPLSQFLVSEFVLGYCCKQNLPIRM